MQNINLSYNDGIINCDLFFIFAHVFHIVINTYA